MFSLTLTSSFANLVHAEIRLFNATESCFAEINCFAAKSAVLKSSPLANPE